MAENQPKSDVAKHPASATAADGQGGEKSEIALREEQILSFWNKNDIFRKSVQKDAPNGEYVFYDGPPFATGLPHYGHIVASVIKDAVPRYWTMRGYYVPRVWGWDCHGLPIENIVEKELGFKHKKDIKAYGVDSFNEKCRERVLTYAHEWEKIIPRIGRWADMEKAYRTMDKPFMESVWWVFKQLYDKKLVYEDYRSMHICPRCETTLSQQEVSEGYKDVKDIAVTVKMELVDEPNAFILAWTTTPWTLPGNVALAVGSDIDYIKIKSGDATYYLSKVALEKYKRFLADAEIIEELKGSNLVGRSYKPLFDYYAKDESLKYRENGWKIYAADFVTVDAGTGIAHEAPAFGADDWELLKKVNLPFVQHVNMDGTFKPEVKDFIGLEVKPRSEDDKVRLGTDIAVLKYLQEHGLLFEKENITHSYPHCWRCDTPLLNYATSSWFVSITQIKDDMLKNALPINWSPENIKDGRWGKWLEGARDWSISRQRFWASVIPIWVCEQCKKQRVFGSASELESASGKTVDDLHKHIVDEITVPCECRGTMRRIPDVLDTWFDSGSMPYGEKHYPFEDKERFDATFPAQFIAEGLDQTRAWFYYLHVLATAIFNKNAFQNVIVNGIVLAEDGKKMSKKLQNYPDPMEVVDKYGADALRLYLLTSPVMQAENLGFSEKGVDENVKKNIGRLNNVLEFYKLYTDTSTSLSTGGTVRDFRSGNVLDQWILARLSALIGEATAGYNAYKLDEATRPSALFIDDLSVWYVRRSRDRFKVTSSVAPSTSLQGPAQSSAVHVSTSSDSASPRLVSGTAEQAPINDKQDALATLRYVLHTLSRVMAPAMPFFAEYLFQAVREGEDEESVHLATWPEKPQLSPDSPEILTRMFAVRLAVSEALKEREKAGINVKQPLARLSIGGSQILSNDSPRIAEYMQIIRDEVNVQNVEFTLEPGLTLDIELTAELRELGFVREIIRAIQMARKEAQLSPHDDIRLTLNAPEAQSLIDKYSIEIKSATHAEEMVFLDTLEKGKVGDYAVGIKVEKI